MKIFCRVFLLVAISSSTFVSCVKMPVQSVGVMDALMKEGERMHKMNVVLVNHLFDDKSEQINAFINKEYTPSLVENFKSIVDPSTDFKEDFTEIMQALIPKINARKDSLQNVLNIERRNVLDKLDENYSVYTEASSELKNLLSSAVHLKSEQQSLVQQLTKLSNIRLDMNGIENAVQQFLSNGGNVADRARQFAEAINGYLDKKQSTN